MCEGKMRSLCLSLLAVSLSLLCLAEAARNRQRGNNDDESFDMLVLALTWPTTNCIEWKEKDARNQCYIPQREWTIHGLWPNRRGEIGPAFCDDSKRYSSRIVNDILKEMKTHWSDIHSKDNRGHGLWGHEWKKHGTCAQSIPELDTAIEYFETTIALKKRYPVRQYLEDAGIVPGDQYTYREVADALREGLGAKPAIQCQLNEDTGQKTLAEIRLCFDKDLEIINCDGIKGGLNQFCPRRDRGILYTSPTQFISLPPASNTRSQSGAGRPPTPTNAWGNNNQGSGGRPPTPTNAWGNSNQGSGSSSSSSGSSGFSWAQAAGGNGGNRQPAPAPAPAPSNSNSGSTGFSWAQAAGGGGGSNNGPSSNTRSQAKTSKPRVEVEEPVFSWASVAGKNLGEGKKSSYGYSDALAADNSFDLFIFSLNWPSSDCIAWKQKNKRNQCYVPLNRWTIQSLKPNKKGSSGPEFCNGAEAYKSDSVKTFLQEMKTEWTDVHTSDNKGNGFWGYQWKKHGACTKHMTQTEYFSRALELKKGLNPDQLLDKNGIKQGGKYTFKEIFDALSSELGKRPSIQCETEEKTNTKILTQIHLCFDKRFNLIDCDGVKGGLNQFCPRKAKDILYPESKTYANSSPNSMQSGKKRN